MREIESGIKRLAIFVVYDKDGIVDDYIPYYLNELSENVSHIVIVCNGKLSDEGRIKLARFTDDIYVRPNTGFDAGAYKDVLLNYLGWDKVYEYDELLLCNDTVFGPLFPFRRVFDEMDKCDVDFWGITLSQDIALHIQSYFVNLKTTALKSTCFKSFWENYIPRNTATETILNFEIKLSQELLQSGFRHSALVELAANEIYFKPYFTASYLKCPVIKKKSLLLGSDIKKDLVRREIPGALFDYVEKHTNYDTGLIWDSIIRTHDITDIKELLKLNYILPAASVSTNIPADTVTSLDSTIAIITINAFYDYYLDLLPELPEDLEIVILARTPEICERLTKSLHPRANLEIRYDDNPKPMMLSEIIKNRKYLCFVELTENPSAVEFPLALNEVWENSLISETYIKNVITCFMQNPHLGYLATPLPYYKTRFADLNAVWGDDFAAVKNIADKCGFGEMIKGTCSPFPVSDAFWCRVDAVRPLLECPTNNSEPLRVIKRILPYAAQHECYLSGVVLSDKSATIRIADFEYMLSGLIRRFQENGVATTYSDILIIDAVAFVRFTRNLQRIYIYGAGEYAEKCATVLERNEIEFFGFIVSDGQRTRETYLGHKVFCLSEMLSERDKCGIIIGLGRKNTFEVYPHLVELGFTKLLSLHQN